MSEEKEIPRKLFDIKQWIPEFSIDSAKRAALCFRETLVICLKSECIRDTTPVGGYCIVVESIGLNSHEFLIHVQSSMSIDGHFGGSKVISSASVKFHCLDEKRTEFMYENGLHEKTIFIGMEDDFYHVKLTRACACDKSTEIKKISFYDNSTFISEGVNILLMRYLALTNFEGTLTFEGITIDGDITESNYICTPAERMEIDGHFLNVYMIERIMSIKNVTIHTIRTYLTPQGRIIRHNWLDVPYLLKINPLAETTTSDKTIKIEMPLRDRWTEDIEMFSKYLDMKSCKIAEQTEYLTDHPEIKQMIADYVQTLLIVKPQNVIDFTIQHFKAFAKNPKDLETSTFQEDYDTDVKSQLAEKDSNVLCSICGFHVDNMSSKSIASIFSTEQDEQKKSIEQSVKSVDSDSTYNNATDMQKANDTSIETSNIFNDYPELKRTCDQCGTIVKVCGKHERYSKCPGCLKIFEICTKCFTIDQILQKLKE